MIAAIAAAVVAAAGILRGMTGFGYALVAVMGLGRFWSPELVTPVVLLIELALTVVLIGDGVLAHVDPARLVPLLAGGVLGTAAGTWAAGALPPVLVRPALDAAVFASAAAALAHPASPRLDRAAVAAAVGFLVGALAAAFAVGGPFVVVWFLAIGAAPATIRANLVVFFGAIDLVALAVRGVSIGVPGEAWPLAALLLVPSVAGAWLGGRLYRRVDAAWWRRVAAYSIAGAAVVSLAGSLLFAA